MINRRVCEVMNMTDKVQGMPSINGQVMVEAGKTAICVNKDAKALIRMYSGYFEIIDEGEVKAEEVTLLPKKKAEKETVIWKEKTALELITEEYEAKIWNKVPNNKKNDIEWIKTKVNSL